MNGDIKGTRYKKANGVWNDTRFFVASLKMSPSNNEQGILLAAIARAIFPCGKRDKAFDRWAMSRYRAIVKEAKAQQAREKQRDEKRAAKKARSAK